MMGTKILEKRRSKYNGELRVLKTFGMGTYIQSDGLTQSGGIVEAIWRQTLRRIPKTKFRNPKCLILGLGGGSAAKIIRKKWREAKITGIDIDPIMVELGKKYMGLDKYGVEIKISDAVKYDAKGYDIVIVDLYNGDFFPKKFEYVGFLEKLKDGNLVIFNRLYYGDKRPEAVRFGKKLEKIFSKVEWFYPEANLMLICNS